MHTLSRKHSGILLFLCLCLAVAVYISLAIMIPTKTLLKCSCPPAICPTLPTDSLRVEISPSMASQLTHRESSELSSEPTIRVTDTTSMFPSTPSPKPPGAVRRPSTCSSFPQYLAIYVHSAAKHDFKRELIRQTWGSPEVLKRLNATLVFILGQSPDPKLAKAVAKEVKTNGDIVQGEFVDTYKNISLKALKGLEWVTRHCQHSRYLLKADDDIFVDVFALVRHLMTELDTGLWKEGGVLICNYWDSVRNRTPIRKPSKWYLPWAEYNSTLFPPFCQGAAYVMTSDVASALYQKSFSVKRLWLDDVYVTGLLREAAGVSATRLPRAYRTGKEPFASLIKRVTEGSPLFLHGLKTDHFKELWSYVMKLERVRQLQIMPS